MTPSLGYRLSWIVPALLVVAVALTTGPQAHPRRGNVLHVADGDTLLVSEGGQRVHVRISRIDCPELDQPGGVEAQRFLARLVEGQQVRVLAESRDAYGRTVARILLPDGRSVAEEMLHAGMAWHFRRYSRDPALQRLEAEARRNQRGLWREPDPVPPWRWRDQGRHL